MRGIRTVFKPPWRRITWPVCDRLTSGRSGMFCPVANPLLRNSLVRSSRQLSLCIFLCCVVRVIVLGCYIFLEMSEEAVAGHSSGSPSTPVRKKTPVIRSGARKIIMRVIQCCEKEKKQKTLLHPLCMVYKRVAEYTGTSERSLRRLKTFMKTHPGQSPATPGKKRSNSGKYDVVRPHTVTAEKTVPHHIEKPEYFESSVPQSVYATEKKSAAAINKMRLSCQLAKRVLNAAIPLLKVGVTTDFIDEKLHKMIIENGAYPSPLRYHGFPKSICTSVNNVICHGIPDLRPLKDGDIINVDVTVYLGGYHGDCSATFLVGNVDEEGVHLVEGARKCLLKGISVCRPGEKLSAIGSAIQEEAHIQRLNVVPNVLGHGIGSYFHGPPEIYHISNDLGGVMLPGMTFTIEPALTNGSVGTCVLEDGWTCVSVDNSRSAQFEETVLIKSDGVEVLT